jgi:orotate phosphoribosyltransferase
VACTPADAGQPGPAAGQPWPAAGLTDARHSSAVAAALVASGAFTADLRMPRDQWFRWKSGILAPCGCNCRRLNAVPDLRSLVDDALADATRSSFPGADYIVAVAHAGIPWAKTVAERLRLPLAYVRAEARAAGGKLVECEPGTGARAVIIEDVVASGGSAARAIQALLAETSLRVAGVQSIANWNFPEMRGLLAPWTVRAVTSYPQVLASAREAGTLSDADVSQLLRFYADPRRHRWPSGPADGATLPAVIQLQYVFQHKAAWMQYVFQSRVVQVQHVFQFQITPSPPQHPLQRAYSMPRHRARNGLKGYLSSVDLDSLEMVF